MDTVAILPKPNNHDGTIHWKTGPATNQTFPFPYTMMCYMTKNPSSSKGYNKMIQTCKYFFEANPILVIGYMSEPGVYKINSKTEICYKNKHKKYDYTDGCCIEVGLRKISCKIWLFKRLIIYACPNFSSLLCDKLYRGEIVDLFLSHVTIPFNDFKILAQSVEKLEFIWEVIIFDTDGKIVLVDKILEVCPKIQYFRDTFISGTDQTIFTASTLKDILKLHNLSNLKDFEMFYIPQIFDIQDVSDFVTKNFLDTKVDLHFSRGVSDEYKAQLVVIREKIQELQIQNHNVSYSF